MPRNNKNRKKAKLQRPTGSTTFAQIQQIREYPVGENYVASPKTIEVSNLPVKRNYEHDVVNVNEKSCTDFEGFVSGLENDMNGDPDDEFCGDCGEQEDDSLNFNDEFNGNTAEELDKLLSEANDMLAEWLRQTAIKAKTDEDVAAWANLLG
jgi:hypothetical protein